MKAEGRRVALPDPDQKVAPFAFGRVQAVQQGAPPPQRDSGRLEAELNQGDGPMNAALLGPQAGLRSRRDVLIRREESGQKTAGLGFLGEQKGLPVEALPGSGAVHLQEQAHEGFVEPDFVQAKTRAERPQGKTDGDLFDEGDRLLVKARGFFRPSPSFGGPGQAERGLPSDFLEPQGARLPQRRAIVVPGLDPIAQGIEIVAQNHQEQGLTAAGRIGRCPLRSAAADDQRVEEPGKPVP